VRSKSGTSASTAKSRAAHLDRLLDEALEETFPASDPIASHVLNGDGFEPTGGTGGVQVAERRTAPTPVTLANGVTLDYDHSDHVDTHHYAFQVSDEEFEAAFGRIKDAGLPYYADPACRQAGQIYHGKGAHRGTYFRDPDGHLMEILTPAD